MNVDKIARIQCVTIKEELFSYQQLPDHQQDDTGDAQDAHQQAGEQIDLKDDARQAGQQIQQPQADEAGCGVDGHLPQTAHLLDDKFQHQKADDDGNDERENIFHGFLHKNHFSIV